MPHPADAPTFVAVGEGATYDWSADRVCVKTTADQTAGRLTVVEDTLKPGFRLPWHHHKTMVEIFYILDGEVLFEFDTGAVTLHRGDTLTIPPAVRHQVSCAQGARMLTLFTPGGFDHYLSDLAKLTDEQLADPALLDWIGNTYDIWQG